MTQVLDWSASNASREVVRRAARALAAGELVALPTETVYGLAASALVPAAVERLRHGKGRPEGKPLTLAVGGPAEALDWAPGMSRLGRRLARRCWPGPLTLVFTTGIEEGLAGRLPADVRQSVCPARTLGLRVPAHDAVLRVLANLPGPLVLSSANRSGEPAATTADEVLAAVGDDVALVVNDGPSRYGRPSSVVQVHGNRWQLLREGVVGPAEVQRQAACVIVFVCTGNTCRSPMAEALCKQLLAQRLGCTPSELVRRGFFVLSAGLAAMMGGGAAAEAVEAVRELGADLTGHVSRPLTPGLVEQADYVIAMTRGHVQALAARHPHLGPRLRLLSPEGADLADPVGCDQQVYRACARRILNDLERLVPEFEQ